MTRKAQPISTEDTYQTPDRKITWFARAFPTFNFYRRFLWYVYRSSVDAKHGRYDGDAWSESSRDVLRAIESVGVVVSVRGLNHLRNLDSPCVFVGNHMSMFETIILPAVIQPFRNCTFVVKQSLLSYPVFCHILNSRNPIGVTRDNPRQDLKAVLDGGKERLAAGTSIVVFPQTTRSLSFDPDQFNSIGIKLAARAKVPVVPIALTTDAWANGKWLKDFGPIDPNKRVSIEFGEPLPIQGRGDEQHREVVDFIARVLKQQANTAA